MQENVRMVRLNEIDPNIIRGVRTLKIDKNESYDALKFAVGKDGQFHPITIRALSDEEKGKVENQEVIYGIIDGHHRYAIARDLGKEEILSQIVNSDKSEYSDIVLGFKLNENIKMSAEEKGKAINDLKKLSPEKDIEAIGEEAFGIKKAMTYRYWLKYRDKNPEEFKEEEPKDEGNGKKNKAGRNKIPFKLTTLKEAYRKLPSTEKDIAKEEELEKGYTQLEAVRSLETQLKKLKDKLFEINGLKEYDREQKQIKKNKNDAVTDKTEENNKSENNEQ